VALVVAVIVDVAGPATITVTATTTITLCRFEGSL
jgi:hypothetical protein